MSRLLLPTSCFKFDPYVILISCSSIPVFISLFALALGGLDSQVSQVDELAALLSKKAAPSGSEPAAAASAAAAYVAYLETGE